MESQEHLRQLVTVAVEKRHRDTQDMRQAQSHLIVRRVDANFVAIDSRRSNELIKTGLDT